MELEAVTGGSTQSMVKAGRGQSAQLMYTIPAGYTGYVVGKHFGVMDTQGAGTTQHLVHIEGDFRLYNESSNANYESWRTIFDSSHDTDGSGSMMAMEFMSEPLPEKSDIRVTAFSHKAGAEVEGRLFILLKRNN